MKLKNKTLLCKMSLALAPVALLMAAPAAYSADSIADAIAGGKTSANLQYRYENVETPNTTAGTAKANTLRLRLGYETAEYQNVGAMFQVQHTVANHQFNDTTSGNRNSNTLNKVADPAGTSVVQSYLSYSGLSDSKVKVGRQVIRYDNDRWVGNVDWRQNWQSFDATSIENKSFADTTIRAAYVTNVNRPNGDTGVNGAGTPNGNTHMKSTFLNVNNNSLGFANLVAYNYRLDYNGVTNGSPAWFSSSPTAAYNFGSTQTTGAKIQGDSTLVGTKFSWKGEYANQKGIKTNAASFSSNYTNLEASAEMSLGKGTVGYEVLGSNKGYAVQTPLATLFAFNGWADMFTTTPTNGLQDLYGKFRSTAYGVTYGGDYHAFQADQGGVRYGRELDLIAEKQIDKTYSVGTRAARFKADSQATGATGAAVSAGTVTLTDTNKLWVYGSMAF
jgi:Alginate export